MAVIKYTPLTYNKDYEYPLSGQLLGGFLGVASTIWVPLYFMYALIRAPGVKLREVMNRADGKSQVRQCLGFRTADFWSP